jgi:exonuclease III
VELAVRKDRLRIATWNLASTKSFHAVVARVSSLDIDICALQEVSIDPAVDMLSIAGGAGGYCWQFAAALMPEELGGGRPEYYGLGILSRAPLSRAFSFPLGPKNVAGRADIEHEARVLQVVVPQLERPITIGNTHLAATNDVSPSAVRRLQAKQISEILRAPAKSGELVLCGDFNVVPTSGDLTELREILPYVHSSPDATYVGEGKHATIDFFCASTPVAAEISVFSANGLSDHNIVVATL